MILAKRKIGNSYDNRCRFLASAKPFVSGRHQRAVPFPPVISQNVHSFSRGKSAAAAGAIVLCIKPFGTSNGR
jgi:hypothetical protein